jgi:hypothetical protein
VIERKMLLGPLYVAVGPSDQPRFPGATLTDPPHITEARPPLGFDFDLVPALALPPPGAGQTRALVKIIKSVSGPSAIGRAHILAAITAALAPPNSATPLPMPRRSRPRQDKPKTSKRVPSSDTITPTTPLRLDIAAQVAFPDGSVSVSSLRREIGRGNLRAEMIAGKTFTTLANIDDMRQRCAVPTKAPDSSSETQGGQESPTDGLSSTAMPADAASSARQAHLRQIAQGLRNSGRTPKKPSPTTSDENTSRNSAAVIRLKSE